MLGFGLDIGRAREIAFGASLAITHGYPRVWIALWTVRIVAGWCR